MFTLIVQNIFSGGKINDPRPYFESQLENSHKLLRCSWDTLNQMREIKNRSVEYSGADLRRIEKTIDWNLMEFERYTEDTKYLMKHYPEIENRYPDIWGSIDDSVCFMDEHIFAQQKQRSYLRNLRDNLEINNVERYGNYIHLTGE